MLAEPNATSMYSNIVRFLSPKGVLNLANHNWKTTQSCRLYGPSPSNNHAPTTWTYSHKSIHTPYLLHAMHKFYDHSFPTPPPSNPDPPYIGQ